MRIQLPKALEKSILFIALGFLVGCEAGPAKVYYASGNVESEVYTKDGKKNGVGKLYYEDGHLKAIVFFKDDIQEDTMKVYYENGNLREVSFYTEGAKTGPFQEFYMNGRIKLDGHAFKQKYSGICKYYDSVTGLLSQVIWNTNDGRYIGRGDSIEFKLTRISTKDSELYISIPSKWLVTYNQNATYENQPIGMQIFAVKPDKNIDTNKTKVIFHFGELKANDSVHTFITVIVDSDVDKTVSTHAIMAQTLDDLKKSGMVLTNSAISDLTIDGSEATSIRAFAQKNGVRTAATFTAIRHNGKIYQIAGRNPPDKFPYYIDLYDEITRSITFRKH